MGNFNEQLVALTMATLRADKKTNAAELEKIKQVATDLECSTIEIDKLIQEENKKQANCSDISAYIAEVAKQIGKQEDKDLLMEACIQVALADKVLALKEVSVLLTICQALGADLSKMIRTIAIFAQNDRDIKIEGSDTDFMEEFME